MADLNKVIIIGRLTRDPELRVLSTGTKNAEIGVAVTDSYRNKDGELVERSCFIDVVVWARQAETTCQYLKKGSPLLVEGRLTYDSWETDAGEKRSRLRVTAERVQFLYDRPRDESRTYSAPSVSKPSDDFEQPADIPTQGDPDDLPF